MSQIPTNMPVAAPIGIQEFSNRINIEEKEGFSFPFWVGPIAIVGNVVIIIIALIMGIVTLSGFVDGGWLLPAIGTVFLVVAAIAVSTSIMVQPPGRATVLEFFGQYMGTIRKTGLVVTLPFLTKYKMSVKAENFETPVSKVNDGDGNPINISSIVVWQLKDTSKAVYAIRDYETYLRTQAEAAVRHVAAEYPYDAHNDANRESLLKNADLVSQKLAEEITARTAAAGIDIIEARINNLSYSVEIAQAMLQRQQASAILDARKIIVQGALGIVEDAVETMAKDNALTSDQRADLVSNLLVVLVSESRVTPVINAGKK